MFPLNPVAGQQRGRERWQPPNLEYLGILAKQRAFGNANVFSLAFREIGVLTRVSVALPLWRPNRHSQTENRGEHIDAKPTPRLRTWYTMPPGQYRVGRDMHTLYTYQAILSNLLVANFANTYFVFFLFYLYSAASFSPFFSFPAQFPESQNFLKWFCTKVLGRDLCPDRKINFPSRGPQSYLFCGSALFFENSV